MSRTLKSNERLILGTAVVVGNSSKHDKISQETHTFDDGGVVRRLVIKLKSFEDKREKKYIKSLTKGQKEFLADFTVVYPGDEVFRGKGNIPAKFETVTEVDEGTGDEVQVERCVEHSNWKIGTKVPFSIYFDLDKIREDLKSGAKSTAILNFKVLSKSSFVEDTLENMLAFFEGEEDSSASENVAKDINKTEKIDLPF